MTDQIPNGEGKPPALTLNIQSWATPLVGLMMLLLGLAAGYFIRPALAPKAEAEATIAPTAQAAATNAAPATLPTTDASQDLMTFLTSQVTHFRGDPNAPVTLIEFSDFQ